MIAVEKIIDGRCYRLTPYTLTQWYGLARAGCPLPKNIVDEFSRVWEEVSIIGTR